MARQGYVGMDEEADPNLIPIPIPIPVPTRVT